MLPDFCHICAFGHSNAASCFKMCSIFFCAFDVFDIHFFGSEISFSAFWSRLFPFKFIFINQRLHSPICLVCLSHPQKQKHLWMCTCSVQTTSTAATMTKRPQVMSVAVEMQPGSARALLGQLWFWTCCSSGLFHGFVHYVSYQGDDTVYPTATLAVGLKIRTCATPLL